MTDDEFEARVVATFLDGSVIKRYVRDGEYWQEKPGGMGYPAEHLSMKRAADRVAFSGGTMVPGVAAARLFYAAVKRAEAERDELRA